MDNLTLSLSSSLGISFLSESMWLGQFSTYRKLSGKETFLVGKVMVCQAVSD